MNSVKHSFEAYYVAGILRSGFFAFYMAFTFNGNRGAKGPQNDHQKQL